jgi:thioredoxin-like negative regulator of GroEL
MQITSGEIAQLQKLMAADDWSAVYALLDRVQSQATTREDKARETYWRSTALIDQGRYLEAIDLLRKDGELFNCQCLPRKIIAEVLDKTGDDQGALQELRAAPIEQDMKDHYGLAIDTKFLYFYLLAKTGDRSVLNRLSEIPDDYRHITMGGKFQTKADIVALLNRTRK